ncbi:MAG: TetR/AcrR family transcriptional regulator C-terminal domain-containing protein [Acidimicrobiales bacterium]
MQRKPREPLSRERVAAAALDFADEHGLGQLSMRKLGAALGVEAMSLYNHVSNKDDLFDAIGELLYGEVLGRYDPAPLAHWSDDAYALVSTFRQVALEHPNAVSLMLDRPLPTQTRIDFLQSCYELFRRAGFSLKQAALAFDMTASWVTGAVRFEIGLMAGLAETDTDLDRSQVPKHLLDAFDFMTACDAWTPDQRFDFGFDTIMDGLSSQLSAVASKDPADH